MVRGYNSMRFRQTEMAPLLLLLIFSFSYSSQAATPLFTPVKKDNYTGLFTLQLYLKTPLQPLQLHLDLGSYLPWLDCRNNYSSSSYLPVYSNSTLCASLDTAVSGNCFRPPGPGCFNDSCQFFPENFITGAISDGEILIDKLATKTGGPRSNLVFSCTVVNRVIANIFKGLARGSKGLAALGRYNYSLPAQVSRSFSSPQVFAVCLPSVLKKSGFVLFNSPGPYHFTPAAQISLTYTPLILGPVGVETKIFYWYKSPDYYVGVSSIKINSVKVTLNRTLLAIDSNGNGGTRLSSSTRYTTLQTSIFSSVVAAFVIESAKFNLTPVAAVDKFAACFSAESVVVERTGPVAPTIDLFLQAENVSWRIHGSNSMVYIGGRWCLGFVDGGVKARSSIVIGAFQLQDNLLQFDLESHRLGFSSSLLTYGRRCDDFEFDSTSV